MAKWIFNKKAKTAVSLVLFGVILLFFYFLVFGTAKAEPTAISGCANISTSGLYNLTNNIIDWNGEVGEICININVSDVEFDCQGYTLDGQNIEGTMGIKVYPDDSNKLTNVSIKNCNLSDWGGNGIYYSYSENSTITNITVYSSSSENIYIYLSSNNNFTNITSSNSQSSGIIVASDSNYNNFVNIAVSNNYYDGIYFGETSHNILANSTAYGNLGDGIILVGSNYTRIMNLVASSNGESGAEIVDESYNNNFTNITASNNTENGIGLVHSDYNIITNITASNNSAGIGLLFVIKNQIINSTTQNNTQYGLILGNSSSNNVTGNAISNNPVGIYLQVSSAIETENTSVNRVWNNIINNSQNGLNWKTSGANYTNYFNTTRTAGINILGSGWMAGNWWSDYSGTDADGDKIGDAAYVINGSLMNDSLPLVSAASANTPPTITNIIITPSIAYTDSTLNCSVIYSDAEGDKGNVTITWYNGSTELGTITQDAEDESKFSEGGWAQGPQGSSSKNTNDSNWSTEGHPVSVSYDGIIWENFTIPIGANNASFNFKIASNSRPIDFYVWNYISRAWELALSSQNEGIITKTFEIPSTSFSNKVQIKTNMSRRTVPEESSRYYEGEIIWSYSIKNILSSSELLAALPKGIQSRGETWNCSINATDAQGLAGAPNSTTKTINNSPPTTPQAGGIENNSRTTNNLVIIKGENSTDADAGDIINYVFWVYEGADAVAKQNSILKSYSFVTVDGNAYYWYVTAEDGVGGVSSATGENGFIENAKPVVTNVTIFPATTYKNSILNCSANFSDAQGYDGSDTPDLEYDKLNVTFSWYNGSDSYSSIIILNIPQSNTNSSFNLTGIQAKGEIWNCTVNATDNYEMGNPNSTTITISNTPPAQPTLSLPANNSRVNETTLLTINPVIDADGDTVYYSIFGGTSVNPTTLLQNTTSNTYNWTLTRGQTYYWRAKAEDNYNASSYSGQFTFTPNSLPIVTQIAISPTTVYRHTEPNCSANFSDAEDNKLNVSFIWYNGSVLPFPYSVFFEKAANNILSTDTASYKFPYGGKSKNQIWICGVNAFDGYENGTSVTTAVTISNSIPSMAAVTIAPYPANTTDTLSCSATGYDLDSDSMIMNFTWYNGSTYYNSSTFSTTDSTAKTLNLTAGIQALGETWNCTVFVNDGTANSPLNSTTIAITSAPPTINAIAINPATAYTNSTLNCSAIYDSEVNKGNVSISWYYIIPQNEFIVQDAENESYCSPSNDFDFGWSAGNPCSNTIDENWGTYGNSKSPNTASVWENFSIPSGFSASNFTVKVAIGDSSGLNIYVWNYSSSSWEVLKSYAADNSGIQIGDFVLPSTSTNGENKIVQLKTDVSGNHGWSAYYEGNITFTKISQQYSTYSTVTILNVMPGQMVSNATLSGIQAKNEIWNCTANATDSQGSVGVPSSTIRAISNIVPSIPEIGGSENASRTTGNSQILRCANSTDEDGDTINYVFYGDTTANPTSVLQNGTATTYTWMTSDGQVYYWRCKAEDGVSGVSGFTAQKTFTENTKPQASSVNIISDDNPKNTTIANLTGQYAYSDANGDTELNKEVLWYNNSKLVKYLSNYTTITDGNTTREEDWNISIRVYDGYEWGVFSNSSKFTILNTAPSSVTLYFNDTNTSSITPTFNWSESADADNDAPTYDLYIFNDSSMKEDNLTVNKTGISQNYTLEDIENLSEGRFYWIVRAYDGEARSAWSDNFTVAVDITKPSVDYTILTPAELKLGQNLTIISKVFDSLSGIFSVQANIGNPTNDISLDFIGSNIYTLTLNISNYLTQDGDYILKINVTDFAGNNYTENKTFKVNSSSSVTTTYINNTLNLTRDSIVNINADNVNTSVENLNVSSNLTTSISIIQSSSVVNSSFVGIPELGKYIEISAPELEGKINSVIIKVFYSDTEVSAKGIDESTLRLWYYNSSSAVWTKYDSPDGGVDTVNNYVWASTSHFSVWGIFGSTPSAAPPAATGGGGGGGGGGCTTTWNCTGWSACINGNQTRTCTKDKAYCNAGTKPSEIQACTAQNITQTPTPVANVSNINTTNLTPQGQGFTFSGITGAAIRTAKNILGEDIYQFGRSGYYTVKNNKKIVLAIIIISVILLFIMSMLSAPKGHYDLAMRLHRKAEIYYNKGNFTKANALFNEAQTYREKGEARSGF